jgi:hypothetical protein
MFKKGKRETCNCHAKKLVLIIELGFITFYTIYHHTHTFYPFFDNKKLRL